MVWNRRHKLMTEIFFSFFFPEQTICGDTNWRMWPINDLYAKSAVNAIPPTTYWDNTRLNRTPKWPESCARNVQRHLRRWHIWRFTSMYTTAMLTRTDVKFAKYPSVNHLLCWPIERNSTIRTVNFIAQNVRESFHRHSNWKVTRNHPIRIVRKRKRSTDATNAI